MIVTDLVEESAGQCVSVLGTGQNWVADRYYLLAQVGQSI